MTRRDRAACIGITLAAGFIVSILAANYLTDRYGFVPVGFGLAATAGTYAAGFTLALRDGVQDTLGRRWVIGLVVAGAVLSFALSAPTIAVASGVAFLVAELADFAVYTPLRARAQVGDRRWAGAVIVSNIVGAVIDTALFVGIAFGAAAVMPAMGGQLVGKTWASLVYVVLGVTVVALLRQPLRTRGGGRDA